MVPSVLGRPHPLGPARLLNSKPAPSTTVRTCSKNVRPASVGANRSTTSNAIARLVGDDELATLHEPEVRVELRLKGQQVPPGRIPLEVIRDGQHDLPGGALDADEVDPRWTWPARTDGRRRCPASWSVFRAADGYSIRLAQYA